MDTLPDAEKIKRYKIFDTELQAINKDFITPRQSGDECKEMFTEFLPAFKKNMYKVEPFLEKYKLDTFQGSSFEGLSVGKSYREYDINVHIKLDKNVINPNGIRYSDQPGFVTLQTEIEKNHAKQIADRVKVYEKWSDKENYLLPGKFKRWGESVMTKTLNRGKKLKTDKFVFIMDMKKSGPAFTLRVTESKSGIKFDVDIVFALSFDSWNLGDSNGEMWVAVAKLMNESTKDSDRSWRYSFPILEKNILNGSSHLKCVLRLTKKVRDNREMTYIASYFIKTIFMWEAKKRNKEFWNSSLGYLFVFMLYKLKDALEHERIDFYFDEKCNLLNRCTKDQIKSGYENITNVLKSIERMCDSNSPGDIKKILISQNSNL